MSNSKLLTGFIVGINESSFLSDSISSLFFCDEIVYVDLESIDDSLEKAKKLGAKCLSHPPVPYAEFIQSQFIPSLDSTWVILLDPDERIDQTLASQIAKTINELPKDSNVGAIRVPTCYYFKGKPLKGTPWGNNNSKTIVFKIAAIEFTNKVHRGRTIKPEFLEISINKTGQNLIHHFWMQSWKQLFAKHRVYLGHEGRSQNLRIVTWLDLIQKPVREFYISFVIHKGYLDGLRGFLLSAFWSWYQTAALFAVKSYSNSQFHKGPKNE